MKIIIEDFDIELVRNSLKRYFDFEIEDWLIRTIIEQDTELIGYMIDYTDLFLDIPHTESVAQQVSNIAMKNTPPRQWIPFRDGGGIYVYEDYHMNQKWPWPNSDSYSEEYAKDFYSKFKETGLHIGVKFGESWEKR